MDMEQQQTQQQQQLQQMIPANILTASNPYFPDPNPDLTGGLPISLDSLRDGPPGSKPFYPYSTLIRLVSSHVPSPIHTNTICPATRLRVRLLESFCWRTSTMPLNLE